MECEYLKLFSEAVSFYARGLEVCSHELGEANQLIATLRKSHALASRLQREHAERIEHSPERVRNIRLQR